MQKGQENNPNPLRYIKKGEKYRAINIVVCIVMLFLCIYENDLFVHELSTSIYV